jgi:hypothetical protein
MNEICAHSSQDPASIKAGQPWPNFTFLAATFGERGSHVQRGRLLGRIGDAQKLCNLNPAILCVFQTRSGLEENTPRIYEKAGSLSGFQNRLLTGKVTIALAAAVSVWMVTVSATSVFVLSSLPMLKASQFDLVSTSRGCFPPCVFAPVKNKD